jgi:Ser/Thr protein kinase RdoA (MazF antagonist)
MSEEARESGPAPRGPALRAAPSPELFAALRQRYGIHAAGAHDLGGSSNLNLHVTDAASGRRYVVRVYRPWVSPARLADLQRVRQALAHGGAPCAGPLPTLDGESWLVLGDRLVEVEPYVEHDGKMDSWPRLAAGLPLLGRIHTLLRPLAVGAAGRAAPATNNIAPENALPGALAGVAHLRGWDPTPDELRFAAASEALARDVDGAERAAGVAALPRQLVHGDYWDNNVLFRGARVVLVADLDFMGERARIDDLALTLYYTNSTFAEGRATAERAGRLRGLVDAYDSGLAGRLTSAERAALPLALARAPLAFIAMIPTVDSEAGARRLAAEMAPDVAWALAIMRDLPRWQAAFA